MENNNFTNGPEISGNNNGYNGNNADNGYNMNNGYNGNDGYNADNGYNGGTEYAAPMYGAPMNDAPMEPPAPPKKKKKGCLIAAIVVLIVGIILGIVALFGVVCLVVFGAFGAKPGQVVDNENAVTWYDDDYDNDFDYDNDYDNDYDWYTDDDYIDMIKDAENSTYGITYGDAFDSFFTDPTWSYFEATTGEDVVEFEGGLLYNDEPVTALVQFILYVDEGTFEVYYLSLDGEDQDDLMLEALIEKVFEEY